MIRVTKERKRKYVSLGISVNPEYWDFSQQEPKLDCPDREYLELMTANKKNNSLKKYAYFYIILKRERINLVRVMNPNIYLVL